MRAKQGVLQKAIPLCGIVLVLGTLGCDLTVYTPLETHSFWSSNARASAAQEVTALIQDFLKNVPANKRSTFDRFFADDVIYTRGTGQVITKQQILADTDNRTAPRANATYTAEDFKTKQYGDTVIVNFKLVMHAAENGEPVTRSFRNTGTFMKRNGQWQAVAWQATPIAEQH